MVTATAGTTTAATGSVKSPTASRPAPHRPNRTDRTDRPHRPHRTDRPTPPTPTPTPPTPLTPPTPSGIAMTAALFHSHLPHLHLLRRGKVRDLYAIDDAHMLIVASDRISAFDVVLPQAIPGKGEVLTRLSNFWFARSAGEARNHLAAIDLAEIVPDARMRAQLGARAVVVKRLKALPIEAIVRGYLIGSGWRDYQAGGALCGIALPPGMREAGQLPAPLYTPSTKAEAGGHDENISFQQSAALIGAKIAARARDLSLRLYAGAAAYARARGIIIADTKFEFGVDARGELHIIDEMLTPDSSRFWNAAEYRPGASPPSYDKQFVRDYLQTLAWDKTAPAPDLPPRIIARTAEKYAQAERALMRVD